MTETTINRRQAVAYNQALCDHYLVATWVRVEKCIGMPGYYKDQVRLDIGLNTPVPIPDLHVDEQGIRGTISFNRTAHYVIIPWLAVDGFMGADKANRILAQAQVDHQQRLKGQNTGPTGESKVIERKNNVIRGRFGK